MKILVTGGAGFIGKHIFKQLLEANHEVVVYDHKEKVLLTPHSSPLTIKGNISDSKLLTESLSGVDAVIHMASFIAVEESVKDPLKYMENNVLGTTNLLNCMREAGVRKIVLSSSATVYGETKTLPIPEDAPLSAANPYAASKIAMEAICQSFCRTDGFDVTVLRYFNPYGPGENHEPETHAIPNFIKAGLEKQPIPLYWKGEQIRDFIYVEDLAEAHISVLKEKAGYNIFNVGSGNGVKIIDILNELSTILGYSGISFDPADQNKQSDKLLIEDLGERKGDVMANYASGAKLKEATGWEPKVPLEEGLKRTVEWFKVKI